MDCRFRGEHVALALTLLLFVGCGEPPQPGGGPSAGTSAPAAGTAPAEPPAQGEPATTETASGEVTLRPTDLAGFQAELGKYPGKVVFVDFWATWCVPCRASFPHTVEWSRKYAGKGLEVITVSMDESDAETTQSALTFLKEQQAAFPNLQAKFDDLDAALEEWGIAGGLPHYRLYRDGRLLQKFEQQADGTAPSHEMLEQAIQQALGR